MVVGSSGRRTAIAHTHAAALPVTAPQELAQGTCALRLKSLLQLADGLLDRAALIIAAVGLAVRPESAALVQVE